MNVSTVIITKNEAANIARCLAGVGWCDDVLVVDDFSTDETREIAESLGVRVTTHRFEGYAAQRNWALECGALEHPWVLMLDADEVAGESFRDELELALASHGDSQDAFLVCRKTMFQGRWLRYSDGFPVWIMRVVRKDRVRFLSRGHGEDPCPVDPRRTARIREPLVHFPFSKGLSDWFDRHNVYSTREALLEVERGGTASAADLFSRDVTRRRTALRNFGRRLPFRGLLRFCYQYVLKRGFLDGRAGFTYSCLMAIYEQLIVLKRRELERAEHISRSANCQSDEERPSAQGPAARRSRASKHNRATLMDTRL